MDDLEDAINEAIDEYGKDVTVIDYETEEEIPLKCMLELIQAKESNFTSDLSRGASATLSEGDAKTSFKNSDANYLKEDNLLKYEDTKTGYKYKFRMLKPTIPTAGTHIEVALKKRE